MFSNSLNSLINRLEKGNLVEKDILVRNMVSNLEIDAQKRVIYRYKSPFSFIFEPEFSTGSPVGELGRTFVEHHDKVIGYICNHSKPALFIINPTPDEIIETLKTQPQYIL